MTKAILLENQLSQLEKPELIEIIVELTTRVQKLEEQLNQHSGNSSKPPSQDSLQQRASRPKKIPTGRKKGGQMGHTGHHRQRFSEEHITETSRYLPQPDCQCDVKHFVVEAEPRIRHQVVDLPEVRYTVTEHQAFAGRCERCGAFVAAQLPASVPAHQMGSGLLAWVNMMNLDYHLSLRKIRRLCQEQWGLSWSIGNISTARQRIAQQLKATHEHIYQQAESSVVLHADETSHYRYRQAVTAGQESKLEHQWLWVKTTPTLTYFDVHYSRGKYAAQALLGNHTGVLVSDRLASYHYYPAQRHQLCLAHVIRNMEQISYRQGESKRLGERIVKTLRHVFSTYHRYQAKQLSTQAYERRINQLRFSLLMRLKAGAVMSHSRTRNQCLHLLKDEARLWTFYHRQHENIPLTNNLAERQLRSYVIFRKLSFFSQSAEGDKYVARGLSVILTCRQLGLSVYQFLRRLFANAANQMANPHNQQLAIAT
jgi:transposase